MSDSETGSLPGRRPLVRAAWLFCWQHLHAVAPLVLDGKLPLRTIECWCHKIRQATTAAFIFDVDVLTLWRQQPYAQRELVHKAIILAKETIVPYGA